MDKFSLRQFEFTTGQRLHRTLDAPPEKSKPEN
jgi:hypothetical protein